MPESKVNIRDSLVLPKMDLSTFLVRRILPGGLWQGKASDDNGERQEQAPLLYLTFDDGPSPHTTPWLLEMLAQEHARATFFLLGTNVARYPELVRQISQGGHCIGNHSYNHRLMPILTIKGMEKEIADTNMRVEEAAGNVPRLFRPPFGIIDKRGADCLREQAMTIVYWGAVSGDWLPIGTERVVERTMQKLCRGNLIVLHEGRNIARQTIAAATQVIRRSKNLGYRFDSLATSC